MDPRALGPVISDGDVPPISGGTLTALAGDALLVSDPDTDRILVVSTREARVTLTLQEEHGAEPGRSVRDPSGRVHVVLRGRGEVVSFDPTAPDLAAAALMRRPVCSMPRGIAYDALAESVVVACGGGELVWLPISGGEAPPARQLPTDLRDVVVTSDRVVVTRFRSAELVILDRYSGTTEIISLPLASRDVVLGATTSRGVLFAPSVAWRAIALPTGEVAILHQHAATEPLPENVDTPPVYYGGTTAGCGGVVRPAITMLGPDGPVLGADVAMGPLPVDLAARLDFAGTEVALVSAGNQTGAGSITRIADWAGTFGGCLVPRAGVAEAPIDNAVAVAYLSNGQLAVQARAPSRIVVSETSLTIPLGGDDAFDTGHALFHASTGFIACASCHPEGGEDGHVWRFQLQGARRTPALHDVAGTAPFHWAGDLPTFHALVEDVMVERMRGPSLSESHSAAIENWLGHLRRPVPPVVDDPERVARGRSLFEGPAGCTGCHSGERLSDGLSHDVGTGAAFQTPSLRGVSRRLPVMHDGCASTLHARFDPGCGGAAHGAAVEGPQIDDLVAYLESL